MNITEANAANDVLRLLLDRPSSDQRVVDRARSSVHLVNGRAYRALSAGPSADEVARQFADLVERRTATVGLLAVFTDSLLVLDLGPRLSCREAEALARWLRAHGAVVDADSLLASHGDADDEGDSHYRVPKGGQR